jgi:hypothetical protein
MMGLKGASRVRVKQQPNTTSQKPIISSVGNPKPLVKNQSSAEQGKNA